MAQKKIIYFTVAAVPTVTEAGEIAALAAYPEVTLAVRNLAKISASDNAEPADYVCSAAGNDFPANYPADPYVRTTAALPPAPAVLSTQKIISSGVEFAGNDKTGSYVNGWTPTIAAGVVGAMLAS